MAAARGEFLTVPEHQRKCSFVRWAVGISFVAIGLLLTLVLWRSLMKSGERRLLLLH